VSQESSHRAIEPPYATLRRRCAALGLPSWRFSGDGQLTLDPVEQGISGQWLRAPYLARLVAGGVARWLGQEEPDIVELWPGAMLIPLVDRVRRRRIAITACLALSPKALESEEF